MTTSLSSISSTQSALGVGGVNSVIFDQYGIVSGIGKNKLRNGDFSINQMAVSGTVTLAADAYGHDMWKAGAAGCTYTFSTVQNVTTVTITAGSLIQVIEGIYLQSGTYCLGWGGTAQGKIGTGAYGASGITGVAVGGTNLNVEFGTGTLLFTQFEWGTQPSYFEFRLNELQLCQVYYRHSFPGGVAPAVLADVSAMLGSGNAFCDSIENNGKYFIPFTLHMRATPTVAVIGWVGAIASIACQGTAPGGAATLYSGTLTAVGNTGLKLAATLAARQYNIMFNWTASARL